MGQREREKKSETKVGEGGGWLNFRVIGFTFSMLESILLEHCSLYRVHQTKVDKKHINLEFCQGSKNINIQTKLTKINT